MSIESFDFFKGRTFGLAWNGRRTSVSEPFIAVEAVLEVLRYTIRSL